MWAFVHIPKTGGTTLEHYFSKNKCNILGHGHENTEQTYKTYPIVFTVIRDPVQRFFSSFNYWKNGASTGRYQRSEFQKREHNRLYPSVASFIDAHTQNSLIAQSILSSKMGFTWGDHFNPQSKWLNGNHNKTWLICYEDKFLIQNTNKFLKSKNNTCVIPIDSSINPTIRYEKETLNQRQLDWIHQKYKDDIVLWKKCENRSFTRY